MIKSNARGGPVDLAKHLKRADTNERVEILGLRGVAALDLGGALREMYAMGTALRTTRTLCHASINVPAHERLTPEQRSQAINRLALACGLTGQPRASVEHDKRGGEGDARALPCRRVVARELDREFGHARVQSVHVERDGPTGKRVMRPARAPSHAEGSTDRYRPASDGG